MILFVADPAARCVVELLCVRGKGGGVPSVGHLLIKDLRRISKFWGHGISALFRVIS